MRVLKVYLCVVSISLGGIVRHSSPWKSRRTSPPKTKPKTGRRHYKNVGWHYVNITGHLLHTKTDPKPWLLLISLILLKLIMHFFLSTYLLWVFCLPEHLVNKYFTNADFFVGMTDSTCKCSSLVQYLKCDIFQYILRHRHNHTHKHIYLVHLFTQRLFKISHLC